MLTMFLPFSTGDDGPDPVQDHAGVPPEPLFTPEWTTLWPGGTALHGCVLHAHPAHTSDAAHALPLFHQLGTGSHFPASEGCHEGCQHHHHHPPGLCIRQLTDVH